MLKHNFLTYGSQIIIKKLGEIIFFPIWWYSLGFVGFIKKEVKFWLNQEKALGFSIWLKNIFVPMYGQADWAGRLISFFIRLVQIIARGILLLFWLGLLLIGAFLWLLAPIFLFIALFFQISG